MPKQPKQVEPLIDLSDDVPRELKVRVRNSIHDLIALYVQYVQEATGVKGDESRVVDRGLERFFASDTGFKNFREKRPKANGSSPRPAPSSAAPTS